MPVNDVESPSVDRPLPEIGKRKGGQKRGVKRGRSPRKDRDFMHLDARELPGLHAPRKHVHIVPARQLGTQGGHIVRDALRPPDARTEERDSHRYAAEIAAQQLRRPNSGTRARRPPWGAPCDASVTPPDSGGGREPLPGICRVTDDEKLFFATVYVK